MMVAFRSAIRVPHQDLATDVERVLAAAQVLSPIPESAADAT